MRFDGIVTRTAAFLAALLLTAGTFSSAGNSSGVTTAHSTSCLKSLIDSTVQSTYNYRFPRALGFADSIISDYPDLPQGYVYKSGIYSKMLAEKYFASPDSVWSLYHVIVDRACRLSKRAVEKSPHNVHALFYYASALVYRSRYEADKSDWFGLMSDGLKSRKVLEKVVGMDSSFYDAYSGIGAFNYYAAHLPWYLKPAALVLGINGNEKEGIRELREAARLGDFAKAEAASFLADIVYTNQKNYPGIIRLSSQLHDAYPGNLDFIRSLCFGYYKLHDYEAVLRYADPCLALFNGPDSLRYVSLSYIRYYRAEAFKALKRNYDDAIADYSRTIEMGRPSVLVSQAYYARGSVYERLGRRRKAISDFKTAVKLNGDYKTCREARTALDSLESH